MNTHHDQSEGLSPSESLPRELIARWRVVLRANSLAADVGAGITVAAVALPLNLALAVAVGLPPITALVAGIIGGAAAAIFGGSAFQVSGPAAALTAMVAALATKFGAPGVAVATLFVGLIQLVAAQFKAGNVMRYFPEAALAGFTTGVGLKLLDLQIPEVLGFDYRVTELAEMMHRPSWLREVDWLSVVAGLGVALTVSGLKQYRRFPAALFALSVVTFVHLYLGWPLPEVGAIPSQLPALTFPTVPDDQWLDIFLAAIPLGILAAVESLLSASAVDKLAKPSLPHSPNLELFGQGIANVITSLFNGMPVTGVIVRSSLNAQLGAKTRLAAIVHSVVLFVAITYLGTHIARVPLPALAGLLCVVGVRLIEWQHLVHLAKTRKLAALAFVSAAYGAASGHLEAGLIVAVILGVVDERRAASLDDDATLDKPSGPQRASIAIAHLKGGTILQPVRTLAAPAETATWLSHVRARPLIPQTAYVSPQASVIGRVVLGNSVHIAAGCSIRADEGTPFYVGDNTNLQDGAILHALKGKYVLVGREKWAIYVGKNVSIAHDAMVHGPSYVGDDCFIGFKSVVHDAVVGPGCFVGIGAIVVGVEIPGGKHVPHGAIVDSPIAVRALHNTTAEHRHFNEDVVDVNRGLASAYRRTLVASLAESPSTARRDTALSFESTRIPSRMKF